MTGWQLVWSAGGGASVVVTFVLGLLAYRRGVKQDAKHATAEQRQIATAELQVALTAMKETVEVVHERNMFLGGRIAELENQLQNEYAAAEQLRRDLAEQRRKVEVQGRLIATLEEELAARDQRIATLESEIAQLRRGQQQ